MSGVEFSRPVRIDTIGTAPRTIEIVAGPAERVALAQRFGLQTLDRLEADVAILNNGDDIVASGRMRADVVQSCVVTDAPVPARIDEPFALVFRPEDAASAGEDEIELDEGEMDVIFFGGASVDVGEAVAQTLALALDPYPRIGDAEAALRKAGVKDESEVEAEGEAEPGPFGVLAGLKDRLGK